MKKNFCEIFQSNIIRPGADKLIEWLESTDFFTAPASTRYHLSRPGGLAEHSIRVYERLELLCDIEANTSPDFVEPSLETITICGLLHDVCKANYYSVEMRNRKNAQGKWGQYPFYVVNDQLPYGHGEKSVYIISGFMKLSREEAMAIRWHMGGFDEAAKGGNSTLSAAFNQFPLALLLHLADMQATYLDEKEIEQGERNNV